MATGPGASQRESTTRAQSTASSGGPAQISRRPRACSHCAKSKEPRVSRNALIAAAWTCLVAFSLSRSPSAASFAASSRPMSSLLAPNRPHLPNETSRR
eukprot:8146466-Heterocapsa_arctica.AAC.1